jgi:hypothetical protein
MTYTPQASFHQSTQVEKLLSDYMQYDAQLLKTKSHFHQFIDYQDRAIIARFVKTSIGIVAFKRQDLHNKSEVIIGMLKTTMPEDHIKFYLEPQPSHVRFLDANREQMAQMIVNANLPFRYADNVIELYEGIDDVKRFMLLNSRLFDEDVLVEWSPDVEYAYIDGVLTEKQTPVETKPTKRKAVRK